MITLPAWSSEAARHAQRVFLLSLLAAASPSAGPAALNSLPWIRSAALASASSAAGGSGAEQDPAPGWARPGIGTGGKTKPNPNQTQTRNPAGEGRGDDPQCGSGQRAAPSGCAFLQDFLPGARPAAGWGRVCTEQPDGTAAGAGRAPRRAPAPPDQPGGADSSPARPKSTGPEARTLQGSSAGRPGDLFLPSSPRLRAGEVLIAAVCPGRQRQPGLVL